MSLNENMEELRKLVFLKEKLSWYEDYVDYVFDAHPMADEFARDKCGDFPKEE